MRIVVAIIIGALMVLFGYSERGYWAFGGEAIVELICAVYVVAQIIRKVSLMVKGEKHVQM